RIRPGRLRRRLAVAFVVVAGVSAGALAVGSFLLVRGARLSDSLARAKTPVTFQLNLAAHTFEPLTEESIDSLEASFEQTDQHVMLITGGDNVVASNQSFDPVIPSSLRRSVQRGQLGYQRLDSGGHHL